MRKTLRGVFAVLFSLIFISGSQLFSQVSTFKMEINIPGQQITNINHLTTYDGGTMFVMSTSDTFSAAQAIVFLKTDNSGTIQWSKQYSMTGGEFHNVVQCPDSGYFLAYVEFGIGDAIKVIKLDKNGTLIFNRKFRTTSPYVINAAPHCYAKNDGGFYVSGDVYDSTMAFFWWQLMELDPTGTILSSNIYNGNSEKSYHIDIDTCGNGDVALLGVYVDSLGFYSPVITRIASGGAIVWSKYFHVPGGDPYPASFVRLPGDFFIIANEVEGQSTSLYETVYMKINGQGAPQWAFLYSNSSEDVEPFVCEAAENSNTLIGGSTGYDGMVLKVDSTGLVIKSRQQDAGAATSIDTMSGNNYTTCGIGFGSVIEFSSVDINLIGCGDTTFTVDKTPVTVIPNNLNASLPAPMIDSAFALIPVTLAINIQQTCSSVGIGDHQETEILQIYPSPANEIVYVISSGVMQSIEVIDVQGQVVKMVRPQFLNVEINVSDLTSGLYFIRVSSVDHVSTQKLIIAR